MNARRSPALAKFSIRNYRVEDFEALYAIDQLCYPPAVAYTRAELRWYMALPSSECLVAEARKANGAPAKIAGFVVTAARNLHGHIVTIDVLEMHRRKGIASALLKRAETRIRSADAKEIWLETATNNETAIAFWKRNGYLIRGRLPHYYPDGVDAFAMTKILTGASK